MADHSKKARPNRLALGASIAAALLSGYGSRQAVAGSCSGSGGTYTCSGVANSAADTTQTLNSGGNPLTVTTTAGFGINVSSGHAFDLTTTGVSLSFTDSHASSITGSTYGIFAVNNGTGATSITATGTVTGGDKYGIYARNSGTDLTINAAAVSGGNRGIHARNYGTGTTSITTTGTVTGTGSDGIYARNEVSTSDLTITAADVSGMINGIRAINFGTGITSITVSGAVTGGTSVGAGIWTTGNSNAVAITLNTGASVSATSGNAIIDGVGDTTVTVNTGASITGSVNLGGGNNQLILNGGTLNVHTGFALTVTGDVTNSTGTINLQNSTIGAATINGDFTGGGQLLIDADFANDTADTLTITGNVLAGGTQVSINDISSGPATGNDITLISVGGTTAAGDFALASNVVNGAYDYNTLTLIGNDWVLQSVAATTGAPVFTPFASTFETLGQSLLTLEDLPSYSDRTRNRMTGASSGDSTGINAPVWMRITGGKRKIDSRSSTTGTNFNTNHWQAQIGADFTLADTASHQFILGINGGYARAFTDVSATTGRGHINSDRYSIGISGTWQLAGSSYIDLQTQKSWYDTDLSATGTGAGNVNGIDGDGYSASIEAGRRYTLSDTLNITPQAQLVYAKVDTDNFTGANGEIVRLTDSKSLKARIGAELSKQFTEDGATHGFILANVIHEFKDKTQVNVSGAQLANSVDKWSGELGAGITHAWDTGTTHCELFAAVTAGTSLNHVGNSNSVQGEAGFKVNF